MLAKAHQSLCRQRYWIQWSSIAYAVVVVMELTNPWRGFAIAQERLEQNATALVSKSGATSGSVEEVKLCACDLLEQARKWRTRIGLQHARSLANLAAQLVAEACGTNSPAYAVCLAELGDYDEDLCRFEQAIEELEKARSIMRKNSNEFELHDLIGVDCNLALARRKHGDIRIASQLYEGVLLEMNREAQRESRDYPMVLLCIANFYLENDESDKAFNYLSDAKSAAERHGNTDQVLLGGVSAALGKYYYLKADYFSSERSFREALAGLNISDYVQLKIHAQATIDYSRLLVAQGKRDEAADLLVSKMDVAEKYFGRSHPLVREIERQSESIGRPAAPKR